jgi:outer membrane protein assembly factor BamB
MKGLPMHAHNSFGWMASLVLFAAVLSSAPAAASDWPCWRNTNRDATSAEQINTDWSAKPPTIAWSKQIGASSSSVSIVGNRVYAMGYQGTEYDPSGKDVVICLDAANGSQIWKATYASLRAPSATPNVKDGVVYTVSRYGDVHAFDAASGSLNWSANLSVTPGVKVHYHHGGGTSAVVDGNLVFVNSGQEGVALNKTTGAVVWQNGIGDINTVAGFSTPVPFTAADSTHGVMFFVSTGLVALNPNTGARLWFTPWTTGDNQNITDPIIVGNQLYISSAYFSGCAVFNFTGSSVTQVWASKSYTTVQSDYWATAVLKNGLLFACDYNDSNPACMQCIEYSTGTQKWSSQWPSSFMPILVGGKMLALGTDGKFYLGNPDATGFHQIASNAYYPWLLYGQSFLAPPSFSNGKMYAMGTDSVFCVDLSPPPSAVVYGDANGDGGFSLADINQMVDWLLSRSTPPASGSAKFTACDVNGDGVLSLADLNLYVDKLLGRITKFPIEP